MKIRLQEQPFEVLLALLESPGEIITREQLRNRLWPEGTFVEFDDALNTAVKKIRAALCDDAAVPRYIETIPRRGYRFLAPVDSLESTNGKSGLESVIALIRGQELLRRFGMGVAALTIGILILALSAWFVMPSSSSKNLTVAVLPFSNMNSASDNEPATDILAQLIWRELQSEHPTKIIIRHGPTNNSTRFSPIAQQSPIDYVVQGGVLGHDHHLHVAVQLVRLHDQNCVWEKNFDRDADDRQTEIEVAHEIILQMKGPLESLSAETR